jgi:hypothetical protein
LFDRSKKAWKSGFTRAATFQEQPGNPEFAISIDSRVAGEHSGEHSGCKGRVTGRKTGVVAKLRSSATEAGLTGFSRFACPKSLPRKSELPCPHPRCDTRRHTAATPPRGRAIGLAFVIALESLLESPLRRDKAGYRA